MELKKRESWFFFAFGGIWGLLLSLFMKLKVEPGASCMVSKHSTTKLHASLWFFLLV